MHQTEFLSSIQVVDAHKMVYHLSNLGTNDIPCHVDFQSTLHEPQFFELNFRWPTHQRKFLITMGINERAERLKHGSSTQQIYDIDVAVMCLTDRKEMAEIFEVIEFTPKNSPTPPGYMN